MDVDKIIFNTRLKQAQTDAATLLKELNSKLSGLSESEAKSHLKKYGQNEFIKKKHVSTLSRLLDNIKNPLIILLTMLGIISFLTGDMHSTIVIFIMIIVGIALRFFQEARADTAAKKLSAMVVNTATVLRNDKYLEIPLKKIVPGDIILLSAGDMIPADARILSAKDLFLNQSALTGEVIAIEKKSVLTSNDINNLFELSNICFLGSSVESGTATALVIGTGEKTYFGSIASTIAQQRQPTNFDKGINQFTWLMIRLIAIMVPIVFLINGLRHNWLDAFLFSMAVAVGLTPEMLPMIVMVNLSKGALAMASKKAIVKHLDSIQNFGAMDVLCSDKTGTITQGKIVLEKHLDINGEPNTEVLDYGYINSFHHTGLKNLLDNAILDHEDIHKRLKIKEKYRKIDEIPFDFVRRRMSVVVEDDTETDILICKGAVEEIIEKCTRVKINNEISPILSETSTKCKQITNNLNMEGYRVIAVAYNQISKQSKKQTYTVKDESGLILLGFLAFLDPPKATAIEAIKRIRALNIDVKILTGDNELVTTHICKKVGISTDHVLLGQQIENMSEEEIATAADTANIFAKLAPLHKKTIIKALQRKNHVVGFLGDGINDAAALKAADVGISVNSAVDIAKEASDIILLKTSLLVLEQGIIEGRKVFGNIIKYIRMAASSNFGNMLSVLGTSIFLPFLPMIPIQILTNNLLYDFSQTTIPTDNVDAEWISKPRKWEIKNLQRFILYIGPISSIFDYITFFVMLYVFNCWNNPSLFQTGWFVESVFTQILIIHVIRTYKIPFIESRASLPLIASSIIIIMISALLPISPLAKSLGFVTLPSLYWLFLIGILLSYVTLTQIVKAWFIRKFSN